MLDEEAWARRHRIVLIVLAVHLPVLFVFGLVLGFSPLRCAEVVAVPAACAGLAWWVKYRRLASIIATAGLTFCSISFVGFSHGSIEAHFHFFIIIGFIALYQDWIPFLWNVVFTALSHGIGSWLFPHLIFNHHAAQASPWIWSGIHGFSVACACVGLLLFWRISEDDQQRMYLAKRIADSEAGRRRFTSDLLVNLARRNQKMLYRQLEIINQLEDKERDPDALSELFKLEHLATRVRRNAESLLVLSGEETSRVWGAPVPLREVVQAAIAETEDLDRVTFSVDERLSVAGNCVADLTHLLAELTENAVRFSPPGSTVSIAGRPYPKIPGAELITIEDWGVGMPPEDIVAANELLSRAPDVDLSESRQLGFHVVARLANRHGLEVSLTPTPGCGVTAAVVLPPELFGPGQQRTPGGRHLQRGPGQPRPALGVGKVGARPRHASEADDEAPVTSTGTSTGTSTATAETAGSWERNGVASSSQWGRWWSEDEEPAPTPRARPRPTPRPRPRPQPQPERAAAAMAARARPVPAPEMNVADDPDPPPTLSRRRPQTHLAPELRGPARERAPEPDHPVPAPRAPSATDALSQYQASRHAARADAERRDAEEHQDADRHADAEQEAPR
ncbi:ATP-binding protein [Pseudonocardia acaciae]|uniref:ATP-binding protein n=1 Tax=Pseudonocardia acaciae TaxID=551276 RepID=UPI00146FFEB1|nr:ATP-binding protein [Pseudonocardia acaciae]